MVRDEAELIALIARHAGADRDDVVLGIGDDAAVLAPPPGEELALCTDTLVEGVHFPAGTEPAAIGHKALAVNLSDLAAMGAEPRWALLSLTLPAPDLAWLEAFARGFSSLAAAHGVRLVGGDTCRGPLSMTVQLAGSVPAGTALTRAGARAGDLVCVSGALGDAALALELLRQGREPPEALRERLERPRPRVALGRQLRDVAHAAIDLSDGIVMDLGRVLDASGVGATVETALVPASDAFLAHGGTVEMRMTGGDDYELLFTLAPGRLAALADADITVIGRVDPEPGLRCIGPSGEPFAPRHGGFDHFTA